MWLVDSFRNLMSGLGTAKDKTVANQHVFVPRSLAECRAAYRGNWIARKVVDIVPFDMLREWRAWQATPREVELIEAAEKALGVQGKLLDGLKRARLEGGSAILIGDGGNATTELLPNRIAQGGIKWLHVFGREEIQPNEPILDPDSPWFGEPTTWQLTSQRNGAVQIHPSRVIRLIGAPILDTVSAQAEQGWGDSVLQALFAALDQATSSPAYLAAMLPEAKQDIISVPGLSNWLKTAASTAELTKRFEYAAQMKSMFGMLLLEGDGKTPTGEIFQQKQLSFDGLADVVKLFLTIASAASDIPATRFLSQSPQGMNATGDSDTRNYYDRCAAGQKVDLTPAIKRLDEVVIWNALGQRPASTWYDWRPLYQPTQKEKGDAFKVLADGLKVLADGGLAPLEVLGQGAKGMVIDTGLFPGIEGAYKKHGDAPLTEAPVDQVDQYDPYGYPGEGYTGTDDPGNVIPFPGRAALGDAAPRTLYVSRKLKNGDDLLAWARSQGFADLMPAGELHVTIAYSRTPVDWMKVGQTWNGEELKVSAGGPRLVERFGEAIVLLFASDELRWRHQEIIEAGASWDHPEYQPHVTFTWNAGDVDLSEVEPYNGPLVFGPELFEPVDEDWRAGLTTDADPLDEEDEDEIAAVTDDELADLFGEEYRALAEDDRRMRDAFPTLVAFLDARRPRHGGGAPRRPFDESKVHRVGGRFASKGSAGEAPAARPRQTIGARHLEEHNVGGDHGIIVNSARVRKYRGHDTVESFVAAHPKGRAHAMRALAADHKAGRISFAAKVQPARVEAPKAPPARVQAPKPAAPAPKPAAPKVEPPKAPAPPKAAEPDDPIAALEQALAAPKVTAAPPPKPAPVRQAPKVEPAKPAPAPQRHDPAAPTPKESRVLKAIKEAVGGDRMTPLVGMQAVRNRLPDLSRKEIDEAFLELQVKGHVQMTGIADPKHPAVRRGEGTDFGGGRQDEIGLTPRGAEHVETTKANKE